MPRSTCSPSGTRGVVVSAAERPISTDRPSGQHSPSSRLTRLTGGRLGGELQPRSTAPDIAPPDLAEMQRAPKGSDMASLLQRAVNASPPLPSTKPPWTRTTFEGRIPDMTSLLIPTFPGYPGRHRAGSTHRDLCGNPFRARRAPPKATGLADRPLGRAGTRSLPSVEARLSSCLLHPPRTASHRQGVPWQPSPPDRRTGGRRSRDWCRTCPLKKGSRA
jgi:hypothetical protein